MGCSLGRWHGSPTSLAGYSFLEVLGAGTYGQVRACIETSSKIERAVKIVHLGRRQSLFNSWSNSTDARDKHTLARTEEAMWKECTEHVNVLRLFRMFISGDCVFFIMERCRGSLLDMLVEAPDELDDEDRESYYCQMLEGIEHVHSKAIIHRDIKPPNFLISSDNVIKLCDFGFAIRRDLVTGTDHAPVGSPLFMAPEMVKRKDYGCAVDIFFVRCNNLCYYVRIFSF
jgi:serine/threonine protein kinase